MSLAQDVEDYFDGKPAFQLVRILQSRDSDVVALLRYQTGNIDQHVAVKVGMYNNLEIEDHWLRRLQFADHINRVILFRGMPNGLGYPYLVTEYMTHGTLAIFIRRAKDARENLPNRLLWAILGCFIRATIGLAWAPDGPDVGLEVPGPDMPSTLTHLDMHNGNFMFGELGLSMRNASGRYPTDQHPYVPMLKLIDFGEARELLPFDQDTPPDNLRYDERLDLAAKHPDRDNERRNRGVDRNLLDIGVAMVRMLSGEEDLYYEGDVRGWLLDDTNFPRGYDPDLIFLVQRLMAVDPKNQPRLDELHELIVNGVFDKTAEDYGDDGEEGGTESDGELERLVQTYILDAATYDDGGSGTDYYGDEDSGEGEVVVGGDSDDNMDIDA
ncbi:uncharacterized protein F4822DRAFT_444605 [Hypoxylon trugodes]|uniref:uncharacterized protein n=1 Tax=Hypoxylon trugodes TaxID=326681 RepID=UPI00219407BD|nr:uncharacterized protein F4822DRAFT_444605 [Hypoxylon trugodes]KAI1386074.1 hypothetical protein F4822DRAFT_444605 [Hypoxylon trugodes]